MQAFLAHQTTFSVRAQLMSGAISHPGLDESGLGAYLIRLHEVAERGFAVNYGETSLDEVGVSVPVVDHRGEIAAVVLVSAPRFRVSTEQLSAIGEAAVQAALDITARLGGAAAD